MSEDQSPYNAANPKKVKEAKRKEKSEKDKALNDLKTILEMPEGRRTISRWLAKFKIGQLEWKAGAEINRNVAQYECANFILGQVIRANPEAGALMLTEAYKEAISNGDI